MTRTDRRCLLQRLAFSESCHFSWDTFPPIPWPMTGDEFGYSVSLSDDGKTLAVGARGADANGAF